MEQEKSPALLVMAAGMGSRYGGLKQMDPLTKAGEVMLDFSVYDALRAGFEKIVIVIKHEIEKDFEEMVGSRIRKHCDLSYAFQSPDDLPGGFTPPVREKPWGTGQAVWAARDIIDRPFAVINADDFYGLDAFAMMADFLKSRVNSSHYAMPGYNLGHTLTEFGTVARGVCQVTDGLLTELTERKNIKRSGSAAAFTEDGENWLPLPLNTPVSMQFFGFHPSLMKLIEESFVSFLKEFGNNAKNEFLLPTLLGDALSRNDISIEVLPSPKRWFGVTYSEDKPTVMQQLEILKLQGEYPTQLWG